MKFLVEEARYVDDLVVDLADLVGPAEYAEQVGLRNADVDALEEADVADVLPAALADDRQHPQIVAIVENGRQVIGDREVGAVQIPDTRETVLELIRVPIDSGVSWVALRGRSADDASAAHSEIAQMAVIKDAEKPARHRRAQKRSPMVFPSQGRAYAGTNSTHAIALDWHERTPHRTADKQAVRRRSR